jgi:hypothetical protein
VVFCKFHAISLQMGHCHHLLESAFWAMSWHFEKSL